MRCPHALLEPPRPNLAPTSPQPRPNLAPTSPQPRPSLAPASPQPRPSLAPVSPQPARGLSILVDPERLAQHHVEQRGRVEAARAPLRLEALEQGGVDAHRGVARLLRGGLRCG
jgi:hypothetical protein